MTQTIEQTPARTGEPAWSPGAGGAGPRRPATPGRHRWWRLIGSLVVVAVSVLGLQVVHSSDAEAAHPTHRYQALRGAGEMTKRTYQSARDLIAQEITVERIGTFFASTKKKTLVENFNNVRLDREGLTTTGELDFAIQLNGKKGKSTIASALLPTGLATFAAGDADDHGSVLHAQESELVNLLRGALFKSLWELYNDNAAEAVVIVLTKKLSGVRGRSGRALLAGGRGVVVAAADAQAGQIADQVDAESICVPIAEGLDRTWSGSWSPAGEDGFGVCGVKAVRYQYHDVIDGNQAAQGVCGKDDDDYPAWSWPGAWTNLPRSDKAVCALEPAA